LVATGFSTSALAQAIGGTSLNITGNGNVTLDLTIGNNVSIGGSLDISGDVLNLGTILDPVSGTPVPVYSITSQFPPGDDAVVQHNFSSYQYARWRWETPMGSVMELFAEPVSDITKGTLTIYGELNAEQILVGGRPVLNAWAPDFSFYPSSDHSISIEPSSNGVAGRNLTIRAGDSAPSGSNLAGGSLHFSAGNSRGNAGSTIEFKTAAGGASGSTVNTAATRMKINESGGIEAGEGLVAAKAPQFVVGKFNDSSTDGATTPPSVRADSVFVVGTGTSGSARKNALRITADGKILIQPAGDISMGDFVDGQKP
jgi:hypothetical protein